MHKGLFIGLVALLGCGVPETFLEVAPPATAVQAWPGVARCVDHGAPELIESPIDTSLSVAGDGLFVVRASGLLFFTRWGQFIVDPKGFLTTLHGGRVQGFASDGRLVDLQVRSPQASPRPTSVIHLEANLDPSAVVSGFDLAHLEATGNLVSHVGIVDSAGVNSTVTLVFDNTGPDRYDFHANVLGPTLGGPFALAFGTLSFDSAGRLQRVVQQSAVTADLAPRLQPISFDFGDPLVLGGTGLAGVTQVPALGSTIGRISHDGVSAGAVEWLEFTEDGRFLGQFTNSGRLELGQLALANFSLARELWPAAGGLLAETQESGPPVLGMPLSRNFGAVHQHRLERGCQPSW